MVCRSFAKRPLILTPSNENECVPLLQSAPSPLVAYCEKGNGTIREPLHPSRRKRWRVIDPLLCGKSQSSGQPEISRSPDFHHEIALFLSELACGGESVPPEAGHLRISLMVMASDFQH